MGLLQYINDIVKIYLFVKLFLKFGNLIQTKVCQNTILNNTYLIGLKYLVIYIWEI